MSTVDVFSNQAVTGTNTYKSAPIGLGERPRDVLWIVQSTGTPEGAVTVEITVDRKEAVDAGTALWVPYTSFSPTGTLAISGAMVDYIDALEVNGTHARLSYENTADEGNIKAFPKSKRRG